MAERIVRRLEQAGLKVFWDQEITPGQPWQEYLENMISICTTVLVLWSRNSTESDIVKWEARLARSQKKMVSCWVERCELPTEFEDYHTADISDWEGERKHKNWVRVLRLIEYRTNVAANPDTATQELKLGPRQFEKKHFISNWALGIGTLIMGSLLAALLLWLYF